MVGGGDFVFVDPRFADAKHKNLELLVESYVVTFIIHFIR